MKKSSVLRWVQVLSWDKGYIILHYGNGLYNDNFFSDIGDLKENLSIFTEKEALDYAEERT